MFETKYILKRGGFLGGAMLKQGYTGKNKRKREKNRPLIFSEKSQEAQLPTFFLLWLQIRFYNMKYTP